MQTRTVTDWYELGTRPYGDVDMSYETNKDLAVYSSYRFPRAPIQAIKSQQRLVLQPFRPSMLDSQPSGPQDAHSAQDSHKRDLDPFIMSKDTAWQIVQERLEKSEKERAIEWFRRRFRNYDDFRLVRVEYSFSKHLLASAYLPAFVIQYKYWSTHNALVRLAS